MLPTGKIQSITHKFKKQSSTREPPVGSREGDTSTRRARLGTGDILDNFVFDRNNNYRLTVFVYARRQIEPISTASLPPLLHVQRRIRYYNVIRRVTSSRGVICFCWIFADGRESDLWTDVDDEGPKADWPAGTFFLHSKRCVSEEKTSKILFFRRILSKPDYANTYNVILRPCGITHKGVGC